MATLSHAEALDLDVHFSVVHDTAADDAFNEAIREADSALEDLLISYARNSTEDTIMMLGRLMLDSD